MADLYKWVAMFGEAMVRFIIRVATREQRRRYRGRAAAGPPGSSSCTVTHAAGPSDNGRTNVRGGRSALRFFFFLSEVSVPHVRARHCEDASFFFA